MKLLLALAVTLALASVHADQLDDTLGNISDQRLEQLFRENPDTDLSPLKDHQNLMFRAGQAEARIYVAKSDKATVQELSDNPNLESVIIQQALHHQLPIGVSTMFGYVKGFISELHRLAPANPPPTAQEIHQDAVARLNTQWSFFPGVKLNILTGDDMIAYYQKNFPAASITKESNTPAPDYNPIPCITVSNPQQTGAFARIYLDPKAGTVAGVYYTGVTDENSALQSTVAAYAGPYVEPRWGTSGHQQAADHRHYYPVKILQAGKDYVWCHYAPDAEGNLDTTTLVIESHELLVAFRDGQEYRLNRASYEERHVIVAPPLTKQEIEQSKIPNQSGVRKALPVGPTPAQVPTSDLRGPVPVQTPQPTPSPSEPIQESALIFKIDHALDDHDWQTITNYVVGGVSNYFGHQNVSVAFIKKDIQGDAKNYLWTRSQTDQSTFHRSVKDGVVYESVEEHTEALELNGRHHKAHCLFEISYRNGNPLAILSLSLRVLK
jgi:hypothetical protein